MRTISCVTLVANIYMVSRAAFLIFQSDLILQKTALALVQQYFAFC